MEPKILKTKIIDNFFDDDECAQILNIIDQYPDRNTPYIMPDQNFPEPFLQREIFSLIGPPAYDDIPEYSHLNKILRKKVDLHLGEKVDIHAFQILTSYFPYRSHTDGVYGEYGVDENNYGAYTLVIPLDNFDAYTVLFNEYSIETKVLPEYMKKNKPKNLISKEIYDEYLGLEAWENMRYLSIEELFPWKKGSCLAMSRYKFHGSDNYLKRKVPFKRGVVCWTAVPNDFIEK